MRRISLSHALVMALMALACLPAGAANKADDSVKAPPISGGIGLADEWQWSSGSRPQAGRYLRLHSGPLLTIDRLQMRLDNGFDALDVWGRDLFGDAGDLRLQVWNQDWPGRFQLQYKRAAFYYEPTLAAPFLGSHSDLSYDAVVRPTSWLGVHGGYSNVGQHLGLLARGGAIQQDVTETTAGVGVKTGFGTLGFEFSSLDLRNRLAGGQSSATLQYGLTYDATFGTRWALGANARWTSIRQPGLAKSELFTAAVDGQWQASHNLWLDAKWNYRDLTFGPTTNAYVGKSSGGGAALTWAPVRRVMVRGGVERTEYQRFNALQTALEKPHETRGWLRADYRGLKGLRAMIGWQGTTLDNLSPSVVPGITSAASLFVESEQRLDARASSMIGRGGLWYAFYQYRNQHSTTRQISNQIGTAGVGLSYPLSQRLDLTTDLYYRYATAGQVAMAGTGADSLVAHLGLGWVPRRHWRLAADYSRVETYNGQRADDNYVTASLAWDPGHGSSLALSYQRDGYDGGVLPGLNYDANILKLSFSSQF